MTQRAFIGRPNVISLSPFDGFHTDIATKLQSIMVFQEFLGESCLRGDEDVLCIFRLQGIGLAFTCLNIVVRVSQVASSPCASLSYMCDIDNTFQSIHLVLNFFCFHQRRGANGALCQGTCDRARLREASATLKEILVSLWDIALHGFQALQCKKGQACRRFNGESWRQTIVDSDLAIIGRDKDPPMPSFSMCFMTENWTLKVGKRMLKFNHLQANGPGSDARIDMRLKSSAVKP